MLERPSPPYDPRISYQPKNGNKSVSYINIFFVCILKDTLTAKNDGVSAINTLTENRIFNLILSEKTSIPDLFIWEFPSGQNKLSQQQDWYFYLKKQISHLVTDLRHQQSSPSAHHVNKRGKFLKKLWCCIGGEYYKIIWFYLSTTIAPTKG